MTAYVNTLFQSGSAPTFSGHETFALRSNWLKKAYDILCYTPDLFYREDAFVLLGVGKNMAHSIRFWGRVCGVFDRSEDGEGHHITKFGHALLSDDGWDPFLVTPASHWLLHWQIAARPEAAFTWFYTFNLLKGGEFTPAQLASQLRAFAAERQWRALSEATINRDIECMLNCYCRPRGRDLVGMAEDLLFCPLIDLGLIQLLPGQSTYRQSNTYHLVSGIQADLPDALVAFSVYQMMRTGNRQTISFSELAYAPRSPGRVFRLDEDALLARLHRLREVTDGRAYYSDQAGVRQVAWTNLEDTSIADILLAANFSTQVSNV
jgi:hypothetical protein